MKISVITATYNSGQTLADTIESVLAQTYKDIEYIIIDGNSTDNTLDIVHRYEPRFNGRLRLVSENDKGIYDAMNKGIGLATGEVVGLLNSDDFYTSPDVLATIARRMSDPAVDAVYADVHYVRHDDTTRNVRHYSSRPFRRAWMRLGFMPAHPSFYCRRSVYERYGSFNISYRIAADFENLLRLIFIHRIRTAYIPRDFVTMRTGGASSSGISSHRQIMKEHLRALRENRVRSNFLLLSARYPYKVCEIALTKVRRQLGHGRH